jgi:hypothetical protein
MPNPDNFEHSSQSAFMQRQITGIDFRLVAVEQSLIKMIRRMPDNFVRRNAEVFCMIAFIGGYFFRVWVMKG